MSTSWRRVIFDTILVLGLCATALVLAFRSAPTAARVDCAAQCAPRAVLAGDSRSCACAPDNAWITSAIETCDRICGPVAFEVTAAHDGTTSCNCGRPDPIRRK